MSTLAHLSDLHATPVRVDRVGEFLNKRALGLISWKLHQRRVHRPEVIGALLRDLKTQRPGHVVVTGDLTNAALEEGFVAIARGLRFIGGPEWITVVPGNHDAYVPIPASRSWNHWAEYMVSDEAVFDTSVLLRDFPTLRVRDGLALVGICSARPSGFLLATGTVGEDQLARLESLLGELRKRELCRVVLSHYPPTNRGLSWRRRLTDSAALREVLACSGAELVLHGHRHRACFDTVPGPEGPIPVVGVRSASDVGAKKNRRAQYHIYDIRERGRGNGQSRFRIRLELRGWDAGAQRFVAEGERSLC